MKPERWQQIDKLLEAALEREEGERSAFLEKACAGDESLQKDSSPASQTLHGQGKTGSRLTDHSARQRGLYAID